MTKVNSDKLSYEIHTNREFKLMEAGEKPLAIFCGLKEEFYVFEDVLKNSDKLKKYYFEEWEYLDSSYYFFALLGEEWRISCYKLVLETREELGHSEQLEWIEGRLLGYSKSQNHEYLDKSFRKWFSNT